MRKHIIASLVALIAIIVTIALSTPVSAAGVNGNPWGYDFNATGGKVITSPNLAFCGYFKCIPNFPKGKGYVMECHDGMYSKSGGLSGSCSGKHRGNWRILYAHDSSVTKSSPAQPVRSQPMSSRSSIPSPSLPMTGSDPYATSAH